MTMPTFRSALLSFPAKQPLIQHCHTSAVELGWYYFYRKASSCFSHLLKSTERLKIFLLSYYFEINSHWSGVKCFWTHYT